MKYDDVENILSTILERETEELDKPTEKEWSELSNRFSCSFSDELKYFIGLMSRWSFPCEVYNVSHGKTNGNDTIELVYEYEMRSESWNPDMIPFCGIGNGDYFCISAKESLNSKVYYFYHENEIFEEYCNNFEEWIKDLPDFLE